MGEKVTQRLAEFIYATRYEDLPPASLEMAKNCILDWCGVTIQGQKEPASRIILKFIEDLGGKPMASVIGTNIKTNITNAALANGVIGHALDFDDYHDETVIHATAACFPAILAAGEVMNASGKDVLNALILAIDVAIRIGLGLGSYHYERGYHSTSSAGIFGATTGAAKIFGLSEEEIVNALGVAGTQSSGLRQVFGSMTKPFHAGKVSMEGVMAAKLAKDGFTCSKKIVEGESGLLEVLTDTPNEEIILAGMGANYYVNRLSIKPFPT